MKGVMIVSALQQSCGKALFSQAPSNKVVTGRARLIRSHLSARFCFELSGILN